MSIHMNNIHHTLADVHAEVAIAEGDHQELSVQHSIHAAISDVWLLEAGQGHSFHQQALVSLQSSLASKSKLQDVLDEAGTMVWLPI
jgi:hypothetical protein